MVSFHGRYIKTSITVKCHSRYGDQKSFTFPGWWRGGDEEEGLGETSAANIVADKICTSRACIPCSFAPMRDYGTRFSVYFCRRGAENCRRSCTRTCQSGRSQRRREISDLTISLRFETIAIKRETSIIEPLARSSNESTSERYRAR